MSAESEGRFRLALMFDHTLHPDTCIAHPDSHLPSYGFVPEMCWRGIRLPEGHIRLRAGRHFGRNKGFGIRHIWEQHGFELPKWGCHSVGGVPGYVASIIVHKAPIYCEFLQSRNGYRVAVLRSTKGYAVLEPTDNHGTQFYSVVTAYRLDRRGHGTQVGSVIGHEMKKAP